LRSRDGVGAGKLAGVHREQHAVLHRNGKASLVTPTERVFPVTGINQLAVDPQD
jgi:hypothetical protein